MCKVAGCEERPGTNAPASDETFIDTDSYNRANLALECRTNEAAAAVSLGQLVIRQAMLLPREKGAARARTAFGRSLNKTDLSPPGRQAAPRARNVLETLATCRARRHARA